MLKYEHLLGRTFDYGPSGHDCYGLVQAFYKDNFDIHLTNYARVEDWWNHDLNLFMDNFFSEGFRPVDDHPTEWRPADIILMAVRAKVANHSAILLPGGKILHHLHGQLSCVDDYRGLYRNTTVAVLRHKDVKVVEPETSLDLMELLPNALRRKLSTSSV